MDFIYPDNDRGGILLVEFRHSDTLDTDDYPAPEDIEDRRDHRFSNLDAAIAFLDRSGVDTDLFEVPWKTDYPL